MKLCKALNTVFGTYSCSISICSFCYCCYNLDGYTTCSEIEKWLRKEDVWLSKVLFLIVILAPDLVNGLLCLIIKALVSLENLYKNSHYFLNRILTIEMYKLSYHLRCKNSILKTKRIGILMAPSGTCLLVLSINIAQSSLPWYFY